MTFWIHFKSPSAVKIHKKNSSNQIIKIKNIDLLVFNVHTKFRHFQKPEIEKSIQVVWLNFPLVEFSNFRSGNLWKLLSFH